MSETDRVIFESVLRVLKHQGGTARRLSEELRQLLKEETNFK